MTSDAVARFRAEGDSRSSGWVAKGAVCRYAQRESPSVTSMSTRRSVPPTPSAPGIAVDHPPSPAGNHW